MRRWLGVLALLALASSGAAAAEADVRIVGTDLRLPPDSHEPQRALVSLRNAGGPARGLGLACTFRDGDGRALETVEASVREIAEAASAVAEVIYYGWPRASGVACRLVGER
ncbi:hypothetical protein [Methylobacterium radiodurans]|nr:hypothetical protein [Methylobacterium radiodurans]